MYDKHNLSFWEVALCVALWMGVLFAFSIIFNACTSLDWNGGECPDCHERYELVGVSRYTKHYACDRCGKEVARM